jgi:hypothetical protein
MGTYSNAGGLDLPGVLRLVWQWARAPAAAFLLILAPLVEVVCGGLLLLGILVSILFEVSGAGSIFPFWQMIALSLGFAAFLVAYYALIGLLSR